MSNESNSPALSPREIFNRAVSRVESMFRPVDAYIRIRTEARKFPDWYQGCFLHNRYVRETNKLLPAMLRFELGITDSVMMEFRDGLSQLEKIRRLAMDPYSHDQELRKHRDLRWEQTEPLRTKKGEVECACRNLGLIEMAIKNSYATGDRDKVRRLMQQQEEQASQLQTLKSQLDCLERARQTNLVLQDIEQRENEMMMGYGEDVSVVVEIS